MKTSHCLAIDLGATSGRTMLATFDGNCVGLKEYTRFANPMIRMGRHLFWDLPALYNEIIKALKQVAAEGLELTSIGIDSWGCDFAFFGKDGQLMRLPYCYRDSHTDGAMDRYFKKFDKRELYDRTGIQFMNFNSVFQLDTIRRSDFPFWDDIDTIYFIPDALTYMLTGKSVCEYTVASTSQILNAAEKDLDETILKSLKLKRKRFGKMVQPGTVVGHLSEEIRDLTGLGKVKVVAVAGHDTASAVAAVPALSSNFAYLSCGTWSLMGIESPYPIINDESYAQNFTNEGGVEGTVRFLKNIGGLWMLEECRKEFRNSPSNIVELSALCEQSECQAIINPDDPAFLHPGSMMTAIAVNCKQNGLPIPESDADFVRVIFRSLAARYAQILGILEKFAPFKIERLNVIGGGSQNKYLMQYTADAIGRPVVCGPAEGTSLGNVLLQLKAAGYVNSLEEMRKITSASVNPVIYTPKNQ